MATDWIVAPERRRLTPNLYPAGNGKVRPVECVVLHYTAGAAAGALSWLTSTQSVVSAHFLISKTGDIWQLAPLGARTWHAGGATSSWPGDGKGNVNGRSIGIELENLGLLRRGVREGTWAAGLADPVRLTPAVDLQGRAWDPWPDLQIAVLAGLLRRLAREFPVLAGWGPHRLVGHSDIDPTRKPDPGACFPWTALRSLLELRA